MVPGSGREMVIRSRAGADAGLARCMVFLRVSRDYVREATLSRELCYTYAMFIVDFVRALYDYVLATVNELPLHTGDPISAAWFLFLRGGWILVVVFCIVTIEHLWVEWREEIFEHNTKYIVLAVDVPRMNEQTPKAVENIFSTLWGTGGKPDFMAKYVKGWAINRYAFEIVSNEGHIRYYIRCRDKMRDIVEAAVYSEYPLAEIQQVEDYADAFPAKWPNPDYDIQGAEFLLSNKDNFPLRTWPFFEDKLIGEFKDPLANMIEAMNKLGPGEALAFQLCLTPADSEWKKGSEALIAKIAGVPVKAEKHHDGFVLTLLKEVYEILEMVVKTFVGSKEGEAKKEDKPTPRMPTPLEREQLEGLSVKASKVGFLSKVRVVYIAKKGAGKGGARVAEIGAALSNFASNNLNSFKRHGASGIKGDFGWQKHMWSYWMSFGFYRPAPIRTFYLGVNWRKRNIKTAGIPYILCTEELASLWHFPTMEIKSPLLRKIEAKRAEPPANVPFRDDFTFPSQIKDAASHGVKPEPAAKGHGDTHAHGKAQDVPENLPFV